MEEKKIVIDYNGNDEEISLKILERDGDILKIESEFETNGGNYLSNADSTTCVNCNGGIVDRYYLWINKNHLVIKEYEGDDDYYIDINDIEKIDVRYLHGNGIEDDEDALSSISLIIHTKNGSLFRGIAYDLFEEKYLKKGLDAINLVNSNIIYEYKEVFYMDNSSNSNQYRLEDDKLRLLEFSLVYDVNTGSYKMNGSIEYEKDVNYEGIDNLNIGTIYDNETCVSFIDSENIKYEIIFLDPNRARSYYDNFLSHLNRRDV